MAEAFPVNNGMTSFWRTEPHFLDSYRSTEVLPDTSDIVIVGAGYAGVTTAYHCMRLSPSSSADKPSIVILEARQACSGATGRNGGHLKPDVYYQISALADKYGMDVAEEVAAFELAHMAAVKACVEEEKIDCDLEATEADFTPKETAESVSGVKGARGCFRCRTGRLWPYKFITQLLERTVSAGVNLQTQTPVLRISETPDIDGRWTVVTTRGSIRAKWVVFSTNAYTSAIAPEYKDKIVPVRGVCSRIVVPNPPKNPLSCSYTLRFNAWDYDYLIPRPDGSIVVGGGKSTFFHNSSEWYNNTDDSRLIESAARYFDNYMQRHFHGWEDTGAYTDRVWTGVMGYSTDSLPHVGHIPNKPCQLVIAGFNGHGMPQVFLSAQAIAQMIIRGATYEETTLPRLFKTTPERLSSQENHILTHLKAI